MLDEKITPPAHLSLDENREFAQFADDAKYADNTPTQLSLAGSIMRSVLNRMGDPAISIILWDGEEIRTSSRQPIARMKFADRASLLKLIFNPDLEFGEGYSAGRITVEGDLTQLMEEVYRSEYATDANPSILRIIAQGLKRTRPNTLAGSRANIHHHYDIGNEFYKLWLGQTMAYTCAYFPTHEATLNQAQVAKMHHVSRKLRLRPGERVVEAGCGWGSLALHMARHYGAQVRAFNISHEQIAYARERAEAEGLSSRVEFVEDDYRNISGNAAGKYDAFVSIGMLEHVGVDNYFELGRIIDNCLNSSGRGLIHTIGRDRPTPLNPWIVKRIFPGAYPPSLGEMMRIFEAANCSVLDVENLRLHYARTLQCWRRNYEQAATHVSHMFDEMFVRMWRLYLAGSEAAFNSGNMQLFQVLFAPRANNTMPWTRDDIYREPNPYGIP